MKKMIMASVLATMVAVPAAGKTTIVYSLKQAQQLRADCASIPSATRPDLMVRRMSCISYISGVVDAVEDYRARSGTKRVFCMPRNSVAVDAVNVVQGWLVAHPRFEGSATDAVIQALRENYPCD